MILVWKLMFGKLILVIKLNSILYIMLLKEYNLTIIMKQATLNIRYSIVVKCTSAAEAVPGKPTLDIKLFHKSDSPLISLPGLVGVACVHLLVEVHGSLGLHNLVGCEHCLVENQLLHTQSLAIVEQDLCWCVPGHSGDCPGCPVLDDLQCM